MLTESSATLSAGMDLSKIGRVNNSGTQYNNIMFLGNYLPESPISSESNYVADISGLGQDHFFVVSLCHYWYN